jgi:hypothetical protein
MVGSICSKKRCWSDNFETFLGKFEGTDIIITRYFALRPKLSPS